MNNCKKIQPLLSEYVDGELPGESAWQVKLHLASCAVCACAAKELASTVSLLSGLPRVDTPASFEEALARRLAHQVLRPHRPTWRERIAEWWAMPRLRPALATAGALAVLIPAALAVVAGQRGAGSITAHSGPAPAEQQFVEQCLEEHASFASTEPLGDQAALLLASSPTMTQGAAPQTSEEKL
jgi:anti-sigma factor RsiW